MKIDKHCGCTVDVTLDLSGGSISIKSQEQLVTCAKCSECRTIWTDYTQRYREAAEVLDMSSEEQTKHINKKGKELFNLRKLRRKND